MPTRSIRKGSYPVYADTWLCGLLPLLGRRAGPSRLSDAFNGDEPASVAAGIVRSGEATWMSSQTATRNQDLRLACAAQSGGICWLEPQSGRCRCLRHADPRWVYRITWPRPLGTPSCRSDRCAAAQPASVFFLAYMIHARSLHTGVHTLCIEAYWRLALNPLSQHGRAGRASAASACSIRTIHCAVSVCSSWALE